MIDLTLCNEWQHRDPANNLVYPWYTKSFLDELVTWKLKNKRVFEFGMGASTLWWAWYADHVWGVDVTMDYIQAIIHFADKIGKVHKISTVCTTDMHKFLSYYVDLHSTGVHPDITVVDAQFRDECLTVALMYSKPGDKIIFDNWQQPGVWEASPETLKFLEKYPAPRVFKQEGHPDWKTALFEIV